MGLRFVERYFLLQRRLEEGEGGGGRKGKKISLYSHNPVPDDFIVKYSPFTVANQGSLTIPGRSDFVTQNSLEDFRNRF